MALALGFIALMTLVNWLGEVFTPSPAPRVVAAPPPAAAPAAASVPANEYVPPLDVIVGNVAWIAAQAETAGGYGDDLAARVADLQARAARRQPPSAATLEAYGEVMAFAAQSPPDSTGHYAARDALRTTLNQLLRKDRWAAEVAIELGRIALADGDQATATRHFTHAIAVAPVSPAAWFGYATASTRIEAQYGALSLAEMLVADAEQGHAVRERFPPSLLEPTRVNLARFAVVSARAQARAARLRGIPLPREVEALAAKPLP